MAFKPTDSQASAQGTIVKEVDANGNPVEGFLHKIFKSRQVLTTNWNVRNAEPPAASPCPIWINTVVVSDSVEGANAGAGFAPPDDDVLLSSSSVSQRVTAVAVRKDGTEIGRQVFDFSLVRAISGDPIPQGGMAIATELWLSASPIDTSKPDIAMMANRCVLEPNGR